MRERIARGDLAGIDAAALLIEANQRLATEFTPVYRRFLAELLAARGAPVLFHCTAGKDRTGFAAAIVLRLLGVPEESIVADYMRSQRYSLAARRIDLLLLRLRARAFLSGVPLDAYAYDRPRSLGRFDPVEPWVVLLDRHGRIATLFSDRRLTSLP